MTKVYKHVFFDLDKTLWDFEKNSREALLVVANRFNLSNEYQIRLDDFINVYREVNELMWKEHREGKQDKESIRRERFKLTLGEFNVVNNEMAEAMNDLYIEHASSGKHLIVGALDLLDYLSGKYFLHIITNGFHETQHKKLDNCGLQSYFSTVTTCDDADATKPSNLIFQYALKRANAKRKESIMIGDHLEVDVLGAKRVGMDQIYLNQMMQPFNDEVTYFVNSLEEIQNIL